MIKVKSGSTTIAQTNVAQKLSVSTAVKSVCVQAKKTNAHSVFIGGADAQTVELEAGDSIQFTIVENLHEIYIKGTANEIVNFIYEN